MRKNSARFGFLLLCVGALTGTLTGLLPGRSLAQEATRLPVPADMGLDSLAARKEAQLKTLPRFEVKHDFRFADQQAKSGITFRNQIVDDAGARYKAVHYDHGNGIAAADVDGDGLHDLYFATFLGSNELWRNLGSGRFENLTEKAGVGLEDRISVSASFADIDNDGDPDLFVTSVRKGNTLFENLGDGRFRDVTEAAGLSYVGHSSAGTFFDYDGDGLLDLFLTNVGVYTTDEEGRGGYFVGVDDAFTGHLDPSRAERSILYRNLDGRRFMDVSEKALLLDRSWSGDATALDFDRDGDRDLYVLNMQGADHYYENVEGKFFLDKTAKVFPKNPLGAMGVKAFDWNNDGAMDLLLTDMHSDMHETVGPEREKLKTPPIIDGKAVAGAEPYVLGNALFEQREKGFVEVSDAAGVENYWPWGVSVDDLNADGWDDVFITSSMNYPFRYALNSVLLNNRGKAFLDSELILGVEPRSGELVLPWFELDCSADGDQVMVDPLAGWQGFGEGMRGAAEGQKKEAQAEAADGPRRHPHCQGQKGRVVVMSAKGSRSSVIYDLDRDGDLDVVTNEFNDHPQVLISNLAQGHKVSFVEIALVGRSSNRQGLGARVEVFHGDRSQVKIMDGKSGYLSQSSLPLYFGLDNSERIDRVEILWPSGKRQTVQPAAINIRLEVTEPTD